MINIGNIICKNGEKKSGYFEIENYKIPITIISGKKKGKIGAIFAGIHGCEYNGIQTAIELAKELTPDNIVGDLIIFHTINISGFLKKIPFNVPEDKKNLNRVFPGKKDGTLSERIAFELSEQIYSKIDFLIDLHCGDLFEKTMEFVYFPGVGEEEIVEKSRKMAKKTGLKYRVKSRATTGAYNSAALQGVPSILIEMGGQGILDKNIVKKYKDVVKKVLEEMENGASEQIEILEATYLESELGGYWYPEFEVGSEIKKGIKIGEIKDEFGKMVKEFFSEYDGVVLYETTTLAIEKGDALIAYGKIN